MNEKENKIINKQTQKLLKKESKIINKKQNDFFKKKSEPIMKAISDKVPDKAISAFEIAFEKGFYTVFEKGTVVIEKGYNSQKIKDEFDVNMYALSKGITNNNINKLDKTVNKGALINKVVTTSEGILLGAFGISLPDIPVFIGFILKSVYEIALKYGFNYTDKYEKLYILYIISTALTVGEDKIRFSKLTDEIGNDIDSGNICNVDMNEAIKETSKIVCAGVMGAKIVQGIFILGAISGIANYKVISDISKTATVKYKKRFLIKLQNKKLNY